VKILSIGQTLSYEGLDIDSVDMYTLPDVQEIGQYDYMVIHGGDGSIRRLLNHFQGVQKLPVAVLNPTGSFNVVAKLHRVPKVERVLEGLSEGRRPRTHKHHLFSANEEIFLFSAGNMGDLQHIFLSETLRFGWLKHGMAKYLLALIFLLPAYLVTTPFMLASPARFFIFTPLRAIKKFGSFYGEVQEIEIDLDNDHNLIELDGDLVFIEGRHLSIRKAGYVDVAIQ
jgi:hypothetical protein